MPTYVVYTESPMDHTDVTVIKRDIPDYADARHIALYAGGRAVVAYTDHFDRRFPELAPSR